MLAHWQGIKLIAGEVEEKQSAEPAVQGERKFGCENNDWKEMCTVGRMKGENEGLWVSGCRKKSL